MGRVQTRNKRKRRAIIASTCKPQIVAWICRPERRDARAYAIVQQTDSANVEVIQKLHALIKFNMGDAIVDRCPRPSRAMVRDKFKISGVKMSAGHQIDSSCKGCGADKAFGGFGGFKKMPSGFSSLKTLSVR